MKNIKYGLVVCLLALCLLQGALAQIDMEDMTGRKVTLEGPATRIVVLTAADCEILWSLGCSDRVIGRGEYCDTPSVVKEVPAVQSGSETNVEQILALDPQLVIMGTMAQSPEVAKQLEDLGIRTLYSDAQDIEGVYTAIRMIGKATGNDTRAEQLIKAMEDSFEEIRSHSADTGLTVYFEVSPLQYGLWTAGKGTFMDELASICGLRNAFSDVEGWAQISEEQVLQRNPDLIVTISMAEGEQNMEEEIAGRSGWEHVKAVEEGHIYAADNDEFSRPGPRLMDAAKTLSDIVQGIREESHES